MDHEAPSRFWIGAKPSRLLVLFLLAPLGYVAGVLLIEKYGSLSRLDLEVDRAEAIAAARTLAMREGIDATSWPATTKLRAANDLRRYRELDPNGAPAALSRLVPDIHWSVLLAPTGRGEGIAVDIGPKGDVLGFQRYLRQSQKLADVGDAAAQARASAALRSFLGGDAAAFHLEGSKREQTAQGLARTYTWRRDFEGRPELVVNARIRVEGDRVTAVSRSGEVDPAFMKNQLGGGTSSVPAVIVGILFVVIAVYAIARFIRRAREQEVPYRHAGVIGVFLFLSLIGMTYIVTDPDWTSTLGDLSSSRLVSMLAGVTIVIMGLAIFVAWGGCEGDVREHFPGGLTSLDALLGGRLASRNVSAAFAVGVALGGLHTLGSGAAMWIASFAPHHVETLSPSILSTLEQKSAVLFLACSLGGGALVLAAHLAMISLLGRWLHTRRTIVMALIVCYVPVIASFGIANVSLAAIIAPAAEIALAIGLALLLSDFLALMVMTAAASWATIIASMLSLPSRGFHQHAWEMVIVASAASIAAAIWMFRARELTDAEVRPQYVRNIADRRALEAQFAAARQAQLRVLPTRLPSVDGLGIAAACRPAEEVSGDYFDFFPIDASRFAVAVADSRGEKLSTALSIALLKGLLVSWARSGRSVREIAARAERHLRNAFEDELPFSFAYCLVDGERRTFSFSRIGSSPFIYRIHNGSGTVEDISDHGGAESSVALQPGDGILILTDGIGEAHSEEGEAFRSHGLANAVRDAVARNAGAGGLMEALFRSVERHAAGVASRDDRTAVVLMFEPRLASAVSA